MQRTYRQRIEREEKGKQGSHEEIEDSVSHKSLYALVDLPLLGCFIHLKRLLQGSGDDENQKYDTKNRSSNFSIHGKQGGSVVHGVIANGEIANLDNFD